MITVRFSLPCPHCGAVNTARCDAPDDGSNALFAGACETCRAPVEVQVAVKISPVLTKPGVGQGAVN